MHDEQVENSITTTLNKSLTSNQVNDIEGLLKGFRDGTQTCMDNLPASLPFQKALLKAQAEKSNLRAKHPQAQNLRTVKGGWFVPPAQAKK